MRNYVVDSLSPEDCGRVNKHLETLGMSSSVEGLYWLPVPKQYLTPMQQEHSPECGPYCLGLSVESDSLVLELLVRGKGVMHCPCIAYASPALREHMINWLDQLLVTLVINA